MLVVSRGSMVRGVVGAAALVAALAIGSPTAVGGQSDVEIAVKDAELTPTEAAVGEDVSVRSVGIGCVSGAGRWSELVWAVFPHGDFVWGEHLGWERGDALVSGTAPPRTVGGTVGSWSVSFPAPDLGEAPPRSGEIGPGAPVTSPVLQAYGPLPFTVDGHQLDFVAKCYVRPSGAGAISISPEVPELGGSAVVTPDDPCRMPDTRGGTVDVELWEAAGSTGFDIDTHDLGPVPVADDGSWSISFDVPADPDHRYAIAAWCMSVEGGRTLSYVFTPLDVREPAGDPIETPPGFWDDAPVPPATEAPEASPAQPVRAEPTYTG